METNVGAFADAEHGFPAVIAEMTCASGDTKLGIVPTKVGSVCPCRGGSFCMPVLDMGDAATKHGILETFWAEVGGSALVDVGI